MSDDKLPDHADAVCVCGHKKSEHKLVVRKRDGKELYRRGEDFHRYKEVLDWPDSEGSYWVPDLGWALSAFEHSGKGMVVKRSGFLWSRDEREKYEASYGPARFVKLQEPNPFAGK